MIGEAVLFYMFAITLIVCASCVILARNPVHSVLFLIVCFLNGTGLFLLLNAELLAMILAIVYVGAVAVLFLFVVMMLDIDFQELRKGISKYIPIAACVGLLLAAELSMVVLAWNPSVNLTKTVALQSTKLTNTQMIGSVLYTDYILAFQISGLILLVAMIGAITLTLRLRPETRRQNVIEQMRRTPEDTLTIHKIESGKGVSL